MALETGKFDQGIEPRGLRLILAGHFMASYATRKLVLGQVGSRNVSAASANSIWMSPCKLPSLIVHSPELTLRQSMHIVR
jgi:hypothetical protein